MIPYSSVFMAGGFTYNCPGFPSSSGLVVIIQLKIC